MVTLPVIGQFGPDILLNYRFPEGSSCTSGPESLVFRVMLQSKCKLNSVVVTTDSSGCSVVHCRLRVWYRLSSKTVTTLCDIGTTYIASLSFISSLAVLRRGSCEE